MRSNTSLLQPKLKLAFIALSLAIAGTALSFTESDGPKLNRLADLLPTDTIGLVAIDELDQFIEFFSDTLEGDSGALSLMPDEAMAQLEQIIAGMSETLGFNITTRDS
jgi:hypothetical protein